MKNEDVSMKTIQITTKSAKKLLHIIAKYGIKKVLNTLSQMNQISKNRGEQSYNNLYHSGQSLSLVDISGNKELTAFKKIANKWGMDFAVKEDKSNDNHCVFFKAKDQEIFDKVFSEYNNYLKTRKPSLHQKKVIEMKNYLKSQND